MPSTAGPELVRRLTPFTLTVYGVGVMVGAGIFVLIGKIAGIVGNGTWLGLGAAALAALPTGLAYAELSSRYPRSAGEAVFVERAFGSGFLSFMTGYLILASGVISVAAVSHGFADYLGALVGLGAAWTPWTILGFLTLLTLVNHLGIEESTWLNVACTSVSVLALLVLVVAGLGTWGTVSLLDVRVEDDGRPPGAALAAAAALAFYAYVGFEDMCNVAEEVRTPHRTLPVAIVGSLLVSAGLYVAVGATAVNTVPAAELAASDVPLALVAERLLPGLPDGWLSLVALFAVTNTALLNLIMASRLVYGMARAGLVPAVFGRVHPRRRSPTVGVLLAFGLALTAALTGFLKVLAEATSATILVAFFLVNLSLVVIRRRGVAPDDPEQPNFRVSLVVPVLGMVIVLGLLVQFSIGAYLRFAGLAAFGGCLYAARSGASPDRSPPRGPVG